MDKELFKKTESSLYRYYSKDKSIKALKEKVDILDKQIFRINEEIKRCHISIEIESSSPRFEEKVQTSGDGTSYAEREAIRLIDIKIKRRSNLLLKKEKILEEIDEMELDFKNVEWRVKDFEGESKILLELKYKEKCSENYIATKMNLNQSQVNRRKQQIIEKIALWDIWKRNA